MRHERLATLLQRTISDCFQTGSIPLPGLLVTITLVEVADNLRSARIYLSILHRQGRDIEKHTILEAIIQSQGRIKKYLSHRLGKTLRGIPELYFYLDDSVTDAIHLEGLLKNA